MTDGGDVEDTVVKLFVLGEGLMFELFVLIGSFDGADGPMFESEEEVDDEEYNGAFDVLFRSPVVGAFNATLSPPPLVLVPMEGNQDGVEEAEIIAFVVGEVDDRSWTGKDDDAEKDDVRGEGCPIIEQPPPPLLLVLPLEEAPC